MRTNFVRISHCLNIHRNSFTCNSCEIRTKLVRISYEFHVNFVQFSIKQSKHTSKHTLHSHGHVTAHAPDFAHLVDRHAEAVFARCHSVVGRSGGAMPVMAKWISDSASALSPLQTSSWCTLPTKISVHCSPTSMTPRSEAGADRERKVRWKGDVGGPAGTDSGGSAKRAWAASPSHSPLSYPQHLVHAGEVPAGQIPSNVQGLLGGGGVQVCVVGLVVFVGAVHKLKRAPCSPSLESGGAGNPWWRRVATISSKSPLCS